MNLTHRLAARPAARPLAALVAVLLALLTALATAAPAQALADPTQGAVAALRQTKVYKDPGATARLSADDMARINAEIGDAPIFVMVMPDLSRSRQPAFLRTVVTAVHKKGTYAAVFGSTSAYAVSDTIGKQSGSLLTANLRAADTPVNGLLAYVRAVKAAGGGTSHAGLIAGFVVLGVVLLGIVTVVLLVRRARRKARERDAAALETLRKTVDEDITAFGEELDRIGFDPSAPAVTDEMRQDYTSALNSYDQAKAAMSAATKPADVQPVTAALEQGRFALATLSARKDGRALPERRPPCFFDPRHGPSVEDVQWAPPGGMPRPVPACAADAVRVKDGSDPMTRTVAVGGEQRPYWDAGPVYAPWAGGYFGGGGGGGMLPGLLIGTALGSLLSGPHHYGGGWGGDYGHGGHDGGWNNGNGGGGDSFTDGFSGGGGDIGGFDWGGGGDSGGGGGDWGGGGDFGGGGGDW